MDNDTSYIFPMLFIRYKQTSIMNNQENN